MNFTIKLKYIFFFALTLLLFRGNSVFAAPSDHFVTTWKTDNPGTSNSTSVTIPTVGSGYNYDVDWDNDGTFDQFGVTGSVTHDFGVAGTYTIRIQGTFPQIYFNNTGDRRKLLSIDQWGTIAWRSMERAFWGASNMNIVATDAPDLSIVTNMTYMFTGASALNSSNLNTWNVNNVTTISNMFWTATTFNQSLNNWNTTGILDMSDAFRGATAFNGNITSWDTSTVTDMHLMFYGATNFNQDISSWDTGSVTSMTYMFRDASNFNQPIGSWDTGSVLDMSYMFYNAVDFDQPINAWDVTSVTTFDSMFYNADSFNQDLDLWVTTSATNMASMFLGTALFNGDITTWDMHGVTTIYKMFDNALAFNQDIGGWNTITISNMESTFRGTDVFNQDLSTWETGLVTSTRYLFESTGAFNGDISTWDMSSVTTMQYMFYLSEAFNQPIGNWDTSLVTDMSDMFRGNAVFNQSLAGWDTSSVLDMDEMFLSSTAFNGDITTWDTSAVTDMDSMFKLAPNFNKDIGGWNTGSVTNMNQMFNGATSFEQDIGSWDVADVTNMTLMFNNVDLSTSNYDSLLIGWDAQTVQPNVVFSAGTSNYCNGQTARTNLDNGDSWTITDGGYDCTGVNNAPTNILVDGGNSDSVNENTSSGTSIATLTTTDADGADTHTYPLVAGTGDEDNASFSILGSSLRLAFTPDYENPVDLGDTAGNNTYSIRLQTNDGNGGTYQKIFVITVVDVAENNTPTNILVDGASSDSIDEGLMSGTSIATLTTTDADGADTHTYTLVAGTGDEDNGRFTIAGTTLKTNFVADYENPQDLGDTAGNNTYSIRLQTNDGNGGTYEKIFVITVLDIRDVFSSSGTPKKLQPGCRDKKAKNYKFLSTHVQSMCIYEEEKNVALGDFDFITILGEVCPEDESVTQNLRAPSANGYYNAYTKDIVREADILQSHLNRLGFNSGPVDGIIGPLTDGAIKRMQVFLGVTPDGFVGPITRTAINNSCS